MIRAVSSNGNENIITENLLRCLGVSHMNLIWQNERFYRSLPFRLKSDLCAMRCQWTKYLLVRFYEFMFYIPRNSHHSHLIQMKKLKSLVYTNQFQYFPSFRSYSIETTNQNRFIWNSWKFDVYFVYLSQSKQFCILHIELLQIK